MEIEAQRLCARAGAIPLQPEGDRKVGIALPERCPRALKYLALPPGWRFLDAPGHEDIWRDATLLGLDE
jgi:hypothetical protein